MLDSLTGNPVTSRQEEPMGWIDERGEHELYVAPMFRDGASGSTHGRQGVNVGGVTPETEDWRQPADIVGWEVRCNHYQGRTAPHTTTVLARWTRATSPEDQDRAAGRFYAEDDVAEFLGDREDVEQLALSLWDVHRKPGDALRMIEAAAEAHARARVELDAVVTAGRAAGLSWADVGRAVGITRQSARERWGALDERD
jgi:hypothetical protein